VKDHSAATRGALVALLAATASLALCSPARAEQPDGRQLFVQHCARCHTTSGAGLPDGHPLLDNFARPPADFTDPLFNSMEAAADWGLVVAHGGPSLGLSEQMPAHADRLQPAQLDAVVAHLDTLADTRGFPPGELNFVRAQRSIKAFPETEFLLLGRFGSLADGADAWRSTLYHGRRLGKRWQVEGKLSQLSSGGESEYEAEVGLKWAFLDRGHWLLLAAGAEAEIPLESSGRTTLIPYLSHASPLGGRFTLQGTLRSHVPTTDVGDGDVELSEVIHWRSTPWRRGVFPGLEAVVAAPLRDDRGWRVSLVPQLHLAMSKRGHVALNLGVELPLTDAADDLRLHAFLLWDMPDGPFWEGW
jgi:mono/diheme cytochrome c family protein